MPEKNKLVIACGRNVADLVRPLIDGSVPVAGCSVDFVELVSGEMLFRSFEDRSFNVAELSFSNYINRRQRGDCPYLALPVFISRSFRHGDFYIRTDRGIRVPQDLRGRRIGLAEYQHTGYVWARGLLEDEYGVRPSDVTWVSVSGGHGHDPEGPFRPPANVTVVAGTAGKTSSDLLATGEVDAVISPPLLACYRDGAPHVGRLFTDLPAVEADYYRRAGIFPMLHMMGIRNEFAAANPGLAENLYRAFAVARNRALEARRAAAAADPQSESARQTARMTALMGDDSYSYGLGERNCKVLNTFLDHHHRQGISARRFEIAELFAPIPLSHYQG